MINNKRKYFLLNYIFILGIILLFLNDHVFKWEFSNWITGKLSDFVGVLIFPFFLTFLFPKRIKLNILFTGIFFLFWKSPFSQEFIDLYNSITFIKITRVVDFSDLIALSVLPLSYYFLKNILNFERYYIDKISIHPILILLPSVMIFMATSPPLKHQFIWSDGNIRLYNTTVKINMNQEDILKKMKVYDIDVNINNNHEKYSYHRVSIKELREGSIDQLVIDNDTINDLQFSMVTFEKNKSKTKMYINGMNISEDIKENEVKKELRKYYRKLLKKYITNSMKN